jgi:hypothetical protein
MSRQIFSLLMVVAAMTATSCARADVAAGAAKYTLLDDRGSQLKADFNRAKGTVRLLFVVDPTCPGCLRGMDDINKVLLSTTQDPRLQTFVVHLPVLEPPPEAKDVGPAAELLHNPHVRNYWNPTGSFGHALTKAVGLKNEKRDVFAWDVWLIYGPEATWEGDLPPRPQLLMHQLWALEDSKVFPHLDRDVFAKKARELLAQLSSPSAK